MFDWNNMLAEEKAPGIRNETLLPESFLINGFGQYVDSSNGFSKYAPMAVFYVEKGKRHRFRIANVASHSCPTEFSVCSISLVLFYFSLIANWSCSLQSQIKNHNLTVIATDGNQIEPIVVQKIITSPGERFDFILNVPIDSNISKFLFLVKQRYVWIWRAELMHQDLIFVMYIFSRNIYNNSRLTFMRTSTPTRIWSHHLR